MNAVEAREQVNAAMAELEMITDRALPLNYSRLARLGVKLATASAVLAAGERRLLRAVQAA
ncbi:MAG TPA: hypothetical protein VFB25_10770 [Gaiellaceae bacterium]|nr:hypothetical protein [Gaiellaceae bacterium]